MKPKHLIVNLYAGPGAGKTTAAAMIFSEIKKRHINADLVTDFAKDMIIQGNMSAMDNQLFVWASQLFRNRCAYERATVTVTDTPVLLGLAYNTRPTDHFHQVALEEYHRFNNFNLFVRRNPDLEYSTFGRVHNELQSVVLDGHILSQLDKDTIPYGYFAEERLDEIVDEILEIVA